jgi:retron-type reverse transcriptase|tara:strand:+ start:666 stop:1904 length:1239 start_codon:yes stop_codon:yes gene_type:complete
MDWISAENLATTWTELKSTRGRDGSKKTPVGIDGVSAAIFDTNLNANIQEISRMLSQPDAGTVRPSRYRFAPLRRKVISREPGVLREICIPRIRDQIVLRAISNVLKHSMAQSGLRLPITSPRQTIKQVIAAREAKFFRVLRTDISRYYQSIPHDQLIDTVRALQIDARSLQLVSDLLTTPFRNPVEGKTGDIHPETGIPTGASISTLLGELYLADLTAYFDGDDSRQLIRYMDDLLLVAKDEEILNRSARDLHSRIEDKGLSLSQSKTRQTSFDHGFEFLGFQFESRQLTVSKKKSDKWIRAYRGIVRKYFEGVNEIVGEPVDDYLSEMILEINKAIIGVNVMQVPYYSMADDLEPFQLLDLQIRQLIGGIFRRQGKRMDGDLRLESAYSWAWKYKRNHDKALAMAKKKFE